MVKQQDIHALLKRNHIQKDGVVLVHTSMRAIGGVENGCDGLIDGFISYLTEGLFLVPTHTWAIFADENPVFNVNTSRTCIGALPDAAVLRKDGVRSLHPTHSLKAFGKRASDYVQGEENANSPCPKGGAWARLYDEDATVLLIGVGLERNTYMHAVDQMLDIPNRVNEKPSKTITAIDYNGRERKIPFHGGGSVSKFFPNFKKAFESVGALTYDRLGNATVGVFHVRKATEIIKKVYQNATYDIYSVEKEIPLEYYS